MIKINCIVCENEFFAERITKKTCSEECYRKLRYQKDKEKKVYDLICGNCGESFNSVKETATYCSISCANSKRTITRRTFIKRNCHYCGKEYEAKSKRSKFCSFECIWKNNSEERKKQFKKLICENCNKEYEVPIDYKTRFCSNSCSRVFMHKNMTEEQKEKMRERQSLSALGREFSDERKKEYREKFSGSGNPRYGIKLSDEQKQKISNSLKEYHIENPIEKKFYNLECAKCGQQFQNLKESTKYCSRECCCSGLSDIMSDKIINGKFEKYKSSYQYGSFWSEKMNKIIWYRSSWEERIYRFFEKNNNIASYKVEPFRIKYKFNNSDHNYIPDVLVNYVDNIIKLIEIKPHLLINENINQSKFQAAQNYCQEKGYVFEVWTEEEIEKLLSQS